jgi:hypothetical protein
VCASGCRASVRTTARNNEAADGATGVVRMIAIDCPVDGHPFWVDCDAGFHGWACALELVPDA